MPRVSTSSSRRPLERVDHLRWVGLTLSLALLVAASFARTGDFIDEHGASETWTGATFLTCGWAAPLMGSVVCGWYANPALFLGWLLLALRRYGAGVVTLAIAAVLALSSVSLFGAEVWQNEGGVNNLRLHSFALGFYLWLASVVAPLGFSAAGWWRDRRFAQEHGDARRPRSRMS